MAYPFNSYFKPRMISTPEPGFRFTPRQPIRRYKELSPGETSQYSYAPLTSICPATYTTTTRDTPGIPRNRGVPRVSQTWHSPGRSRKREPPGYNETWKTQRHKIDAAFSPLNPFKRDITEDSMGGMSNKWCNTAASSLDIMQNTGVKKTFPLWVSSAQSYNTSQTTSPKTHFPFQRVFPLGIWMGAIRTRMMRIRLSHYLIPKGIEVYITIQI